MFYEPYRAGDHAFAPFVLWMGRHRGGRGFGHFRAGFVGGRGRGHGGFRTGRKLASADLQLIILALLAENPSHGYKLIKAIEERSEGFYSPSPGMIYPALTYLEEIGYATSEIEGAKKRYRITTEGRRHRERNAAVVEGMLDELARVGAKMAHVRGVFSEQGSPDDVGVDPIDLGGPPELNAARRALKMALRAKDRCPPEEAERIAEILRRAAAAILTK